MNKVWLKIKSWLDLSAERKLYQKQYREYLNEQNSKLILLLGLIMTFAWIGYAFITDKALHPEFPALIFYRMFFTLTGLSLVVVSFIPAIKKYGTFWVGIGAFVGLCDTALFTGMIADDANYVSGLQMIFVIVAIAPLSRGVALGTQFISIILFITGILIGRPNLNSAAAEYSLNNLAAAVIIGTALVLILDIIRFGLFLKNIIIQKQMDEVHRLKVQQDGDYFLTSILIQPLAVNRVRSKYVKVQTLVKQYKQFQFKHHESDIGGDICVARSIQLQGKKYTIFLNGDAMGKSIQGAGGALVMGTVLNSVITRTKVSANSRHKYPEQWIRECFLELQKVFVSFDGSMMISAVLGLLDEQTGMLYHINAEHPWMVLLRDNRARFLGNETFIRKIGIEGIENSLVIYTIKLQAGDTLIAGSDGRDDLLVGYQNNDIRIINEDEMEFLARVEESRGELVTIRDALLEFGELTDDLSLLSVTWTPPETQNTVSQKAGQLIQQGRAAVTAKDFATALDFFMESYALNPDDEMLIQEIFRAHVKLKQYQEAFSFCLDAILTTPWIENLYYFGSYCAKHLYAQSRKRTVLNAGIDLAECLRLRQGIHLKNLVNLADLHRLAGNQSRCLQLIEEIENEDPGNDKAVSIKSLISA